MGDGQRSIWIFILVGGQVTSAILFSVIVIRNIGPGTLTDSYFMSQTLPLILSGIAAGALQGVWLPRLAKSYPSAQDYSREAIKSYNQSMLLALGILIFEFAVVFVTGFLFFRNDQNFIVISLILGLTPVLYCLNATQLSLLRSKQIIIAPEMVACVVSWIALIPLSIFILKFGIIFVAILHLVRYILQTILFQYLVGMWPRFSFRLGVDAERWAELKVILFGGTITKFSPLVDRSLASQTGGGDLTLFALSQAAANALSTVLDRTFAMPSIAPISRLASESRWDEMLGRLHSVLFKIFLLGIVAGVFFGFAGDQIQKLIALILNVDGPSSVNIFYILALLMGSVFISAYGGTLVYGFYSIADTATPTKIGVLGFLGSIAIKYTLFEGYGIFGLAAAVSIYYLINLIFMYCLLIRKINTLKLTG